MFSTFVVLCLVGTAFAQVPGLGGCPNVEVQPNFDVSKYLGRWYEAERFFAAFELNAKCVTADYTAGENGTIKVVNAQLSQLTGNPSSIVGRARVPNASEPAKLKVTFSPVPFGIEGDYWVLGTDYDSFSVVFACTNLQLVNFQFAWILTREQNPDASVIAKADAIIAKNKLNRSTFSKTDQTTCKTSEQEER